MGIARSMAKLLLEEGSCRPWSGKVGTLGRQHVFFTRDQLHALGQCYGIQGKDVSSSDFTALEKFAAITPNCVSDNYFFRFLGFEAVESLDYSNFEQATHIVDLNLPDTPTELNEQYDMVFDGGTIEHIFNVPMALAHIFRMLKTGGRVVHSSPSSNHIDHGFYMFSPTLFYDYYTANNWRIDVCRVFRYSPLHFSAPWLVSDYKPGCLDDVSFGGLDDGMYGIFLVATKTESSVCDRVPQQGFYRNQWSDERPATTKPSFFQRIYDRCAYIPLLQRLLFSANRRFRQRPGLRLPIVGKY